MNDERNSDKDCAQQARHGKQDQLRREKEMATRAVVSIKLRAGDEQPFLHRIKEGLPTIRPEPRVA